MTSSDFLLRYASVTTALFDHIEHDMLAMSSAFIEDDESPPLAGSMPCCRMRPSCCACRWADPRWATHGLKRAPGEPGAGASLS